MIRKEDEIDIGSIPLLKKPVLTFDEEFFFQQYYPEWIIVMVRVKAIEGIEKYGKEKWKEIQKEKGKRRQRDRYFIHKFLSKEFLHNKEIDHIWHNNGTADYDYIRLMEREENQVREFRELKSKGWRIEKMCYDLWMTFATGKEEK